RATTRHRGDRVEAAAGPVVTVGAYRWAATAGWRNRALLGVSDQLVNSGTNFLVTFLAARWLDVGQFGALVVALAVVYGVIGLQRAIIGDPLVVHASAMPSDARKQVIGDATMAAFWLGLLASLAVVLLWVTGIPVLRELVWFAPWLPMVLVHEAGRYGFLSEQRPGQALITGLVWAAVQTAGFIIMWLTGDVGVPAIVASWGAGALAGAGISFILARRSPLRGQARRWFRQSRHLSGWFLPTAVVDQVQNQSVVILVGALLSLAAAGGLRATQLIILQPAQTLMVALTALIVPWVTRTNATDGLAALHVRVRRLGRYFAVAGGAILLCIPFREPLLQIVFPRLTVYQDLVPPTAVMAMLLIAVVPYDAELRGLREVRHLFVVRTVATSLTFAGVIAGAGIGSLVVITWTLALSSLMFYCGVRFRCSRVVGAGQAHDGDRAPPGPVRRSRPTTG
ncbi:MAG: hypothetical protein M3313_15025, partial [Actinomycetota bacterium]|nr:hypothetical protein [Actinomycetota bacterium]